MKPLNALPNGAASAFQLFGLAGAIFLASCGGSSQSAAPASPPSSAVLPATAPQIGSFIATPATIAAGQSATLSWSVTGATSLSINNGVGAVTGSSVTVSPSVSTDYVLTASNAAGSITATTRLVVGQSSAINDVIIGDPAISYVDIEPSPDMSYMVWTEEGASATGASIAWLCALDRENGTMIPANGRGVRIADIRFSGAPEWGQDAAGLYLISVDVNGRFLRTQPRLNADGSVAATTTILSTPANTSRAYPYPTRIAQAGGYVVYQQADPLDPTQLRVMWIDLNNPTVQTQVTQGPVARLGELGVPPFQINIQRWFYDATTNRNGIPVVTYGDAEPGSLITLEQLDFSGGSPIATRVAGTSPLLYDPFPFLFEGDRFVIAGINTGPTGAVYRRDAQGRYTVLVNEISVTGSNLRSPNNFASTEVFVRNGKAYSAFQLNEPGAPGTTNAEIWLTSVFDASVRRRLSPATASRRADPEFFFGTEKTWILYYARVSGSGNWQLHRTDTGL